MARTTLATCISGGLMITAPASADIINVPADWPTIQLAINNSQPGDEIVIADGTYVGSFDTFGQPGLIIRSASGDASTVTIVGDDQYAIYIASFEIVIIQNVTIQNSGQGIFLHNDSGVVLDGCHLNGYSQRMLFVRGGSNVTATGCTFANSTTEGVFLFEGSVAHFTDCLFQNISGGAVTITTDAGFGSTFIQCDFIANSSPLRGGAISAGRGITVTSCDFIGNVAAQDGGAIAKESQQLIVLAGCRFQENVASDDGGAVYSPSSFLEVDDCVFLCNSAADGGALWIANVSPPGNTIDSCFFALNEANGGGGIFSNAPNNSGPLISNTTFCGNHIGQIKGGWLDAGGNLISVFCLAEPPIDCDFEWPFPSHVCVGDIVTDGEVGVYDLIQLILAWGTPNLTIDLNRDGTVDVLDLILLIGNWGPCE